MKIPFNKPYFTGKETDYIKESVATGKISGDGLFTEKCHRFFQTRYGFHKTQYAADRNMLIRYLQLCGSYP